MPPAATHMNRSAACPKEKVPVVNAATANCRATKAVASFTRLSPSRIVWIRCGTGSRRRTAVAKTASGGDTIAPNANAAAQGKVRQNRVCNPCDGDCCHQHQSDREQKNRAQVSPEIAPGSKQRCRIEQRRQKKIEHDFRIEFHFRANAE